MVIFHGTLFLCIQTEGDITQNGHNVLTIWTGNECLLNSRISYDLFVA